MSQKIEKTLTTDQEKALFQRIVESRALYDPSAEAFLKTAGRGEYSEAKDIMLERVRPAQSRYLDAIKDFHTYHEEESARETREMREAYHSTRVLLLSLTFLAVCCGGAAAWLLIRNLLKQLGGG